jgi:peptidyl-prolyl cis-trans isomerase SurA
MRAIRRWMGLTTSGTGLRIVFAFVLLPSLLAATPARLRAETTNRIVAIVNSDIITLHELNTSIKGITGSSAKELRLRDEPDFYEVRRAVLDNLINDKLTRQQVMKLGIKVAPEDIDAAVERVKRENHLTQEELIYSLKQEGITIEEYRERMKGEIERSQLVNYEVKSKIVITEEDVRNYYQEHSGEYREIPQVRVARILLEVRNPDDEQEISHVKSLGVEILDRLKEGDDFFKLARTYSQGPAASEGGDLGWIKVSQLERTLREKIVDLSPGEYTDLELASPGFQIIKLIEEKKGEIRPLEQVHDAIYSKLSKEKVEKRYAAWLKSLREESYIKIKF